MAPEWNAARARGWFGMTAAHGRAHLARALLEGNALALRDVIEAIARRRATRRARSCASAAARRARLLCELRAHITGLPVCVPDDVETTARGAAMLAAAGAGLHPAVADGRARRWPAPRGEPVQPDPELREVYDDLHRAPPRLYAALRPLFNGMPLSRRRVRRRRARSTPAARAARASRRCAVRRARPARHRRRDHRRGRGARRRHARAARRRSSRRATSRPGPRARRASSSTAACATSRWATSGSCARRCASASCCSRGSRRTSSRRCRSCGRCAAAAGSARTSAPGSLLYDTIGGARSVPRHRHLSRRGALAEAPALRPDALVGAVQFHDALEDDARMVAVVARTAAAHGAHIATRVRVTGFRGPGEVEAVDEETRRAARRCARGTSPARPARGPTSCASSPAGARRGASCPSKGIHVFVAARAHPDGDRACSRGPRRASCSSSRGRAAG